MRLNKSLKIVMQYSKVMRLLFWVDSFGGILLIACSFTICGNLQIKIQEDLQN